MYDHLSAPSLHGRKQPFNQNSFLTPSPLCRSTYPFTFGGGRGGGGGGRERDVAPGAVQHGKRGERVSRNQTSREGRGGEREGEREGALTDSLMDAPRQGRQEIKSVMMKVQKMRERDGEG